LVFHILKTNLITPYTGIKGNIANNTSNKIGSTTLKMLIMVPKLIHQNFTILPNISPKPELSLYKGILKVFAKGKALVLFIEKIKVAKTLSFKKPQQTTEYHQLKTSRNKDIKYI